MSKDSFGSRTTLAVGADSYSIFGLGVVYERFRDAKTLPFSVKILLENLLRNEDGLFVSAADIAAVANWQPAAAPSHEIAFTPSRVLLQDFSGVPAIADLAAMREALKASGGDPRRVNPRCPVELIIDHSVQVDAFGSKDAFRKNAELEFQRNDERYRFLKWGQRAFDNLEVVPPGTGIIHQINLEFLARVVMSVPSQPGTAPLAYPDTVVGTDSHTTMINGLGVLGWGVGGIEAEAAMLGQPVSMLLPQVVGVRLHGSLSEQTSATDLVLTLTHELRRLGVVGKFVEFFGPGLSSLPLADRATVANMAPEYGATTGLFPLDAETIRYLRFSGRSSGQVALVESYARAQGLWTDEHTPPARYSDVVDFDLASVTRALAGPSRPDNLVPLADVPRSFASAALVHRARGKQPKPAPRRLPALGGVPHSVAYPADQNVSDGTIVIAAITSCTNTSNPAALVAAGLLARKAAALGLSTKPWVKPSIAPGSKVVAEYLQNAGLLEALEDVGFYIVGYGCTTCVGNSGPLLPAVSKAIEAGDLCVVSVLSGNRNFEGRVHAEVRANYLASPPLVVAYALVGRIDVDLANEPLGTGEDGRDVYLEDIWPTKAEVTAVVDEAILPEMFTKVYTGVFAGDERWRALAADARDRYAWEEESTYFKLPPYFEGMSRHPSPLSSIQGARVLALLGDRITTDHISPVGAIEVKSPAGKYLLERGVKHEDFNAYGARRGNHEVMVRGTFASVRLRNMLVPGTEGGITRHFPSGEQMSIFEASCKYIAGRVPLLVIAGKEYGTGSARDWAAKGTNLLGVRAILAESYERIHRSNLVGMGILPLELPASAPSLDLTGEETYDLLGVGALRERCRDGDRALTLRVTAGDGTTKDIRVTARLDTPQEVTYYEHGGILPYVLRQLLDTM